MEDKDEVLKVVFKFDKQLERELYTRSHRDNCPSYWKKKLFLLTRNLTLDDWRIIRGPDYWPRYDHSLSEIDQLMYMHRRVKNYLDGKRK